MQPPGLSPGGGCPGSFRGPARVQSGEGLGHISNHLVQIPALLLIGFVALSS